MPGPDATEIRSPDIDLAGRPRLDPFLLHLTRSIASVGPRHLARVEQAGILFVAGAARRDSRASVRPLTFGGHPPQRTSADGRWVKPRISIAGREIRYEICLRPRFFLAASPSGRVATLIHELLHLSPELDGTLDAHRRHQPGERDPLAAEVQDILQRWEAHTAPAAPERAWLSHRGELRLAAWLSRPPSRAPVGTTIRLDYDERDLFEAVVEQR
ncbi:MAG: hypothetical protein IT384_05970 [Deltaproteobacteria bacterium]|nr:hypothetical protein [Deltaproteobacteria bacterium]